MNELVCEDESEQALVRRALHCSIKGAPHECVYFSIYRSRVRVKLEYSHRIVLSVSTSPFHLVVLCVLSLEVRTNLIKTEELLCAVYSKRQSRVSLECWSCEIC